MKKIIPPLAMFACAALPAAAQDNAPPPPAEDRFVPAKVRLLAAPGKEDALVGARITGSWEGAANGFVALAPIAKAPAPGQWLEVDIPAGPVYPWVKVEAAPGAKLFLAEAQFLSPSGTLPGGPFGTAVPKELAEHDFKKAMDGDPETWFESATDGYVGVALPGEARAPHIWFQEQAPGAYAGPVQFKMHFWPPDALVSVHYTTDGSTPTEASPKYTGPITVGETTSFAARAFRANRAPGGVVLATYRVGPGAVDAPEVRTYHVGNSLTDSFNPHLQAIALSAGHNLYYMRKVILGCAISMNWERNGDGFASPDWWANNYNEVFKRGVDHLFLQPYPNPGGITPDTTAGNNFIRLGRETNPSIQPWLYAQWTSFPGPFDGFSTGWGWGSEPWSPTKKNPANWEEAMANRMEYYTLILDNWNKAPFPELEGENGEPPTFKPARLAPVGDALVRLKREIEAGKIPGIDNFQRIFSDGHHLSLPGMYFASLVLYGCIFGESPEGKVTHANTELTREQAEIFQRIAWEAVLAEPRTGVAEDKPEAR